MSHVISNIRFIYFFTRFFRDLVSSKKLRITIVSLTSVVLCALNFFLPPLFKLNLPLASPDPPPPLKLNINIYVCIFSFYPVFYLKRIRLSQQTDRTSIFHSTHWHPTVRFRKTANASLAT